MVRGTRELGEWQREILAKLDVMENIERVEEAQEEMRRLLHSLQQTRR